MLLNSSTSEAFPATRASPPRGFNSSLIDKPTALPQARMRGRLWLNFDYATSAAQTPGRTRLIVRAQQPPLQVIRAFTTPEGAALVHLHNLSGGVLGGDHLELKVDVGPNAQAQLTSTGATRLYRQRADFPPAEQHTEIHVAEGGLLEYLPDPLIPFAGAGYHQKTQIELEPGAGLFWWETIAPGREARGESFEYDRLQIQLDLTVDGRPVALERLRLEPALRPLNTVARLGPYRYLTSFYICRPGLEGAAWLRLEATLLEVARELSRPGDVVWGVSTLSAHGLIVRGLSQTHPAIATGLLAFWQPAKQALYGRAAVPPRKVY
jgi:urease accessory protein